MYFCIVDPVLETESRFKCGVAMTKKPKANIFVRVFYDVAMSNLILNGISKFEKSVNKVCRRGTQNVTVGPGCDVDVDAFSEEARPRMMPKEVKPKNNNVAFIAPVPDVGYDIKALWDETECYLRLSNGPVGIDDWRRHRPSPEEDRSVGHYVLLQLSISRNEHLDRMAREKTSSKEEYDEYIKMGIAWLNFNVFI